MRSLALWLISLWWCAAAGAAPHPTTNGSACAKCHPDAHHGEFVRPCADCHTMQSWSPSTFDAAKHATTKYVLDGKHLATPCSGCHQGGKPRTSFIIASAECLDCHLNPHGTQFAKRSERGCADCHTTAAWKQWKVDHRSFPLVGAHASMACTGCHPGKTIDSPIATFRGLARTCEGCHTDFHASQFATAPKRACADCHTPDRWRSKFDHDRTRYPLEGVHATLACDRCHAPTTLRNDDTSIRWRLGYTECKACHANPHRGVTIDCKGCHGFETWKPNGAGPDGFDHDATGFKLRQTHAATTCLQCHDGKPKPPSARTNSTCQSCHADPHMGRLAGPCFECHTATAWQDTATFEQHRRTRMPLTGRHAVLECSACHKRQADRPWRDLPTDCYGCHSVGLAQVPGHIPDAIHRACGLCHETTAWKPALTVADVTPVAALDHDRSFVLSTSSHRAASCDACHVDRQRSRAVRCDGCHSTTALRAQHRAPVATTASSCLGCHPRGARR